MTGIGGGLTAGDYDLIQFSGLLTGTASNIALGTIPLASGLSASIQIDSDSVNLHVGVGLMGDYNGDGKVDAADYVVWRKNPNVVGGGDPIGYTTWRANFGNPPGSGSGLSTGAAVPEPASTILIMVGITILCLLQAQSRRKYSIPHRGFQ